VASAGGSVWPVWSRLKGANLAPSGSSGATGLGYEAYHYPASGAAPGVSTTYYHGDHLGSSRQMTTANGYPVWEASYRPYGEEHNPQLTVNHYKFPGKERDG